MAAHPSNAGLTDFACRALSALVESTGDKRAAMDAGASEVLRDALKRFPNHAAVQQRANATLQAISFQLGR
jgi:hypothetical protein